MADQLTVKVASELIDHEAIVLESYLDSSKIWTWSVGVTDKSGHTVARYKDHPSTLERALQIYVWLLRKNYIPAVQRAFGNYSLSEAQFAAALSFHYNTGAIGKTDWVDDVKHGRMKDARAFLENHYLNGGVLQSRRNKEAALFFDGKWSGDGKATIYPVKKPSYTPDWAHPRRVEIAADLAMALAG